MAKRGQMEIIGILIIIVLLILGLLFTLRFAGDGDSRGTLAKRVKNKEVGSNMLHTILNSKSPCRGLDVEDLLKDCGEYGQSDICIPGGGSIACPDLEFPLNNVCSCPYVEDTFQYVFDKTLKEWKIRYEFSAVKADNDLFDLETDTCEKGSDPAIFAIPTSGPPVVVTLRICD